MTIFENRIKQEIINKRRSTPKQLWATRQRGEISEHEVSIEMHKQKFAKDYLNENYKKKTSAHPTPKLKKQLIRNMLMTLYSITTRKVKLGEN